MTLAGYLEIPLAVLGVAVAYRVYWACVISTSFVPDEYYQTIEPAYNLLHRNADTTLFDTWEWRDDYRIRSYVPIIPYLLLYQIISILKNYAGIFLPEILITKGPRLINGLLSSYGDILLFRILQRISNSNAIASVILCVHLFSWSCSYCLSRTLINSTETALLIIGVFFWSLEDDSGFSIIVGNSNINISVDGSIDSSDSGSNDLSEDLSKDSSNIPRSDNNPLETVMDINAKENIEVEGTAKGIIYNLKHGNKPLRNRKEINSAKNVHSKLLPQVSKTKINMKGNSTDDKFNSSKFFQKFFQNISFSTGIIAVTVHSRPTAILFWAPLLILGIVRSTSPLKFIKKRLPIGVITIFFCIVFDSYCYNSFTITPYNFFTINVSHNYASKFYGSKSWHWNFSHGLPVMLGLYTPFLIFGIFFTPQPIAAIILEIVSFSYIIILRFLTAHQEYRFLLPCLPFLHIAVGYTIWNIIVYCLNLDDSNNIPKYTILSYFLPSYFKNSTFHNSTTKISVNKSNNNNKNENESENANKTEENNGNEELKKMKSDCDTLNTNIKPKKFEPKTEGTKIVSNYIIRYTGLCLLIGIFLAHFSVAVYLSTRHQVSSKIKIKKKLLNYSKMKLKNRYECEYLNKNCMIRAYYDYFYFYLFLYSFIYLLFFVLFFCSVEGNLLFFLLQNLLMKNILKLLK